MEIQLWYFNEFLTEPIGDRTWVFSHFLIEPSMNNWEQNCNQGIFFHLMKYVNHTQFRIFQCKTSLNVLLLKSIKEIEHNWVSHMCDSTEFLHFTGWTVNPDDNFDSLISPTNRQAAYLWYKFEFFILDVLAWIYLLSTIWDVKIIHY